MNTFVVGIDIAKQKFDVAVSLNEGKKWLFQTFPNQQKGYQELLKWLNNHGIASAHAVMEATGSYGEDLAEFLYATNHNVSILNPSQIKAYSQSLLSRAKTDKVDARLIAEFGMKHSLPLWVPLPEERKKLRSLYRCLESFKLDLVQLSNRLEHAKDSDVIELLHKRIKALEVDIKEVKQLIKGLIHKTILLKQQAERLLSIPGIGETTAWGILAEIPQINAFQNAKQLSAYAGLNPSTRMSGSSVRGKSRLSKVGSPILRKMLYFPALTALRVNPLLQAFANRLKANGKVTMVVIGAVQRKLLHIIFGILKNNASFNINPTVKL